MKKITPLFLIITVMLGAAHLVSFSSLTFFKWDVKVKDYYKLQSASCQYRFAFNRSDSIFNLIYEVLIYKKALDSQKESNCNVSDNN